MANRPPRCPSCGNKHSKCYHSDKLEQLDSQDDEVSMQYRKCKKCGHGFTAVCHTRRWYDDVVTTIGNDCLVQ